MAERTRFLLPAKFRFAGSIFFIAGIIAGVFRFYFGIKPKILDAKVFAVYSEYLDEKYLKLVTNNLGEEITLFLVLSGLFLIAFSKEKTENEMIKNIRYHSLIISFYVSFAFLLAAIFFTFGFAFLYMLILFSAIPMASYIVIFRHQLYQYRNNLKLTNPIDHQDQQP